MNLLKSCAIASMVLSLGACATAPPPKYQWGNYEASLYKYTVNPAARPEYKQALRSAIERGRAANNVAPGLLAELGYLCLEDGDFSTSAALFDEEARRFPDSAPFLKGVIERARSRAVSAPAPVPTPSASKGSR